MTDNNTYTILEVLHGSRAFGTSLPSSDSDYKGVFVGPRSWYYGYLQTPEQLELNADHVLFEIRKFLKLAAAANPTVFEVLWAAKEDQRITTPAGEYLINKRELFLSKKVANTFGGYALSQLNRIKTHRRWLLEPPEKKPTRADFGLPEKPLISKEQVGAAEAMLENGRLKDENLTPNFLAILDCERRYRKNHKEWSQYQHWLTNRNPARAQLEAQFGYDTKHAQHLIRLMRMGIEILSKQEVLVKRPDREELLEIRSGRWSYEQVIEEATKLQAQIKESAESSSLKETADESQVNQLCNDIIEMVLSP